MSALVRYIIWFVFDKVGMGSRVRGPGFGSDIHLDPTSHPNARSRELTDEETGGCWYGGPRLTLVSQFPSEERSSVVDRKANGSSTLVRSSGSADVSNVFPFPISHRKVEVDDKKESQKRYGGTRKMWILFYWSLVGWLLFNL